MDKIQYQLREIRLRPAYSWDCPDCGREIFIRGIVPEMSLEDEKNFRDEHGVELWEEGDFVLMPQEVTCPYCNAHFQCVHFSSDSDV
jgi:DNA-directed RNA polymerase subunit RPC12/RpoP